MPPKSPDTATVPLAPTNSVTTAPVTGVVFLMTGKYPSDTSPRHGPNREPNCRSARRETFVR